MTPFGIGGCGVVCGEFWKSLGYVSGICILPEPCQTAEVYGARLCLRMRTDADEGLTCHVNFRATGRGWG